MAMDGLRGYVQLASGLAETSKAKATEAASALLALTGGLSSARSGKDVQVQVQDLAEELLAAAAANRRSLIALIRSEVERAMARAPIPPDELDRARAAMAKLSADVEELRAQVMASPAVGEVAAKLGLAGHSVSRPASDPWSEPTDAGVVVDTAFTDTAEPATPPPPRRRPPRTQIASRAATRPVPAEAVADADQASAEPHTETGATVKAAAPATKATKKTAAKTATAKKATAKKATTTASATKASAKKASAKKATSRTTAKKATAKKATTKKTAAPRAGSNGSGS
jgi:hypothetical protein